MTAPEPVPVEAGHVLFLCTGNAARSVMAGVIFAELAPAWKVTSAGTHVVEGQPVSWRTQQSLAALGYTAMGHRSRQLRDTDVASADLIVGLAPEHVAYVRRHYPEAASRTATLRRLTQGWDGLELAAIELEAWEEITDPAGGDIDVFDACAAEVLALTTALVELLTPSP